MSWPVRTRICLECRAALSDGEHCTWVRHTAVSPADPAQQRQLSEAVWRAAAPPAKRLSLRRELVRVLRELLTTWSAPEWTPSRPPLLDVPPPPRFGDDPGRRVPRGASEGPLWTARTRYTGHVRASAMTAPSPIAGTPCVAYGLWLLDDGADGSPVLLRDGATIGFDVDLDDGRAARIPACTADLVTPGARLPRDHPGLRAYLRHLAPTDPPDAAEPRDDRSPLLPYREAREAVLRPGDAMTLLADLHLVPDGRLTGGAYREQAAGVLAPVGRVAIEVGSGEQVGDGKR